MNRSRLIGIVTTLTLSLAVLLAACGGGPAASDGAQQDIAIQASFQTVNDQRLSSFSLDLAQLPPASEGQAYAVWWIGNDGKLTLAGTAVGGQTFEYTDPAGENLVGKVAGARVSVEEASAVSSGGLASASENWFGGGIPQAILADVRLLVVSAPDTPANTPYDPGLKAQTILAHNHAELAQEAVNAGDLASAKNHAEHIINILSGSADAEFGDHNGDGETQNPGDGYGVWPYAFKVTEIADRIAEVPNLGAEQRDAALVMGLCARHISTTGPQAIQQAKLLIAAENAEAAKQVAQALADFLDVLANGTDANGNGTIEAVADECGSQQIYQLAHRLFDFQLTKGSPAK